MVDMEICHMKTFKVSAGNLSEEMILAVANSVVAIKKINFSFRLVIMINVFILHFGVMPKIDNIGFLTCDELNYLQLGQHMILEFLDQAHCWLPSSRRQP